MKPFKKIASELIGFERRERRATYLLVLLLLVLLIIRFSASGGEAEAKVEVEVKAEAEDSYLKLFRFDPNTVTYDDLLCLGLTERQASTFMNYRNSGAKFYNSDDIGRVYGLDSALVARLKPWVSINQISRPYKSSPPLKKVVYPPPSEEAGAVAVSVLIDLNRCSKADLERLPGIGAVLSERILKYRNLLGGFVTVGQLREVYGIDSATYDLVKERVTATKDSIAKVWLDSCTFGQMAKHPYIGAETARAIIKYRTLMRGPVTVGALVEQRVITATQAELIAPYISLQDSQPDEK